MLYVNIFFAFLINFHGELFSKMKFKVHCWCMWFIHNVCFFISMLFAYLTFLLSVWKHWIDLIYICAGISSGVNYLYQCGIESTIIDWWFERCIIIVCCLYFEINVLWLGSFLLLDIVRCFDALLFKKLKILQNPADAINLEEFVDCNCTKVFALLCGVILN